MSEHRSVPKKLHLGCGLTTPAAWLNVDGSPGAWLARHRFLKSMLGRLRLVSTDASAPKWSSEIFIHDLSKPLPFSDNAFTAVYSSHTLEHLYLAETIELLRETFRVLEPGGVARMVVPDLRAWVDDYLGVRSVFWPPDDLAPKTAGDRLNRNLMLRTWNRPHVSRLKRLLGLNADLHSHKWMYDADSLGHHMRQAGFVDVERRDYMDSRIPELGEVEKPDRLLEGQGVAVEGVKPR